MLAGHRGLSTTQRVHRSGCGSTEARRGACIKRHSNRSFGPHRTARPVNAAIIAGNPPDTRIDRLREFWTQVTADSPWSSAGNACVGLARGDAMRQLLKQMSAGFAMASGARGFFKARPVPPLFQPAGTIDATSFYDTSALRGTLQRLVDFDRINAGTTCFSVGAVNVRTGNFVYFDNDTHTLRPEHVMASGALPPGFPAVEIEGELYWDGGLV